MPLNPTRAHWRRSFRTRAGVLVTVEIPFPESRHLVLDVGTHLVILKPDELAQLAEQLVDACDNLDQVKA